MNDAENARVDHDVVTAVLEGGPLDFPEAARKCLARLDDATIKIQHMGGHEHFQRVGAGAPADHAGPVVYRWTTRTRIAE
jgi:hypothetical protein